MYCNSISQVIVDGQTEAVEIFSIGTVVLVAFLRTQECLKVNYPAPEPYVGNSVVTVEMFSFRIVLLFPNPVPAVSTDPIVIVKQTKFIALPTIVAEAERVCMADSGRNNAAAGCGHVERV